MSAVRLDHLAAADLDNDLMDYPWYWCGAVRVALIQDGLLRRVRVSGDPAT